MVEDSLARGVSHHQVSSSLVQLLELQDCQIAQDELRFPAPSPKPQHYVPEVPDRLCGYLGLVGSFVQLSHAYQTPSLRVPQERNQGFLPEA